MKIYFWNKLTENNKTEILQRPISLDKNLSDKVSEIISNVRTNGDKAVRELTTLYDGIQLDELQITSQDMQEAITISAEEKAAIQFAYNQIKAVHQATLPCDQCIYKQDGIEITQEIRAIESIGLYIPGGSAPLVSSVLMLGVPAQLAQCETIVLCTPPNKQGLVDPRLLYAASLCGIKTIFKIGGAQAIAALAYGTASIPKVNKIFGPGNAWVTEAKKQIANDVLAATIDMPAGPSEVLVIADDHANPQFVAADLLAQAEHSEDAQAILIALSETFADAVISEVLTQMRNLPRNTTIAAALNNSRIIIAENIDTAIDISNRFAPEHLILNCETADQYLQNIKNAGTVFVGKWAAETLGDYVSGSNHVLPTYGYAKTISGLSVKDFMKTINFQKISITGFQKLNLYAQQLSEIEGLHAHKQALVVRELS